MQPDLPGGVRGAQLARAVAARASADRPAAGSPTLLRKPIAEPLPVAEHLAFWQVMLMPPSAASEPPERDMLMKQARAGGHRALWEMRLALVWGGVADPSHGRWEWRQASPGERIGVLQREAAAVRGRLAPAEREQFNSAVEAARAHIFDVGVAQRLDATPDDEVYEIPDFELEELRAIVKAALDTVKKLDGVTTARWTFTDATRYTPEHARFWRLAKDLHPDNRYIQWGAANGGKYLPNVLYVVAGVLATADLALKIGDQKARSKIFHTLGEKHDPSLRGAAHDLFPIVQGAQSIATLAGGIAIAKLIWQGKGTEALQFLQAFTAAAPKTKGTTVELARANFATTKGLRIPLRTLSFVTSLLQLTHGVITLLSSSSTDSERLEAAWET